MKRNVDELSRRGAVGSFLNSAKALLRAIEKAEVRASKGKRADISEISFGWTFACTELYRMCGKGCGVVAKVAADEEGGKEIWEMLSWATKNGGDIPLASHWARAIGLGQLKAEATAARCFTLYWYAYSAMQKRLNDSEMDPGRNQELRAFLLDLKPVVHRLVESTRNCLEKWWTTYHGHSENSQNSLDTREFLFNTVGMVQLTANMCESTALLFAKDAGITPMHACIPSVAKSEPLREMLTTYLLLEKDSLEDGSLRTVTNVLDTLGHLAFNFPMSIPSRAHLYELKPGLATRLIGWLEDVAAPNLNGIKEGLQSSDIYMNPISVIVIIEELTRQPHWMPSMAESLDLWNVLLTTIWACHTRLPVSGDNQAVMIFGTAILWRLITADESRNRLDHILPYERFLSISIKGLYHWVLADESSALYGMYRKTIAERNAHVVMNGDRTWIDQFRSTSMGRFSLAHGKSPIPTGNETQTQATYKEILTDGEKHLLRLPDSERRNAALLAWDSIYPQVGVSVIPLDLRVSNGEHEAETRCRSRRRGTTGCSWLKCLMYGRDSETELFWCVGCEDVLYCGNYCQERYASKGNPWKIPETTWQRDWENHAETCGHSNLTCNGKKALTLSG